MTVKFKHLIKNIDFFGKTYGFEENQSQSYHTIIGNLITISIIIVCIVIGFLFGEEIYKRDNPQVIDSFEILDFSRIHNYDIPILISAQYANGSAMHNFSSVLDVHVTSFDLFYNSSSKVTYSQNVIKECNTSLYSKQYADFTNSLFARNELNKNTGQSFYCLNQNYYFQNDHLARNSTFLNVRFAKCNPEKRACHPKLDLVFSNMIVTFSIVSSYLDPKNYTSPITYYFNNIAITLSDALSKRVYVGFEKRRLVTNKGWILDSIKEEEYIVNSVTSKDVNIPNKDREYAQVTFNSPSIVRKTIRSYMKIQELFAKIGGFFNALMIMINVILIHYINFKYYLNLIYDLDTFNEKSLISNSKILNKSNNIFANPINHSNLNYNSNSNNQNSNNQNISNYFNNSQVLSPNLLEKTKKSNLNLALKVDTLQLSRTHKESKENKESSILSLNNKNQSACNLNNLNNLQLDKKIIKKQLEPIEGRILDNSPPVKVLNADKNTLKPYDLNEKVKYQKELIGFNYLDYIWQDYICQRKVFSERICYIRERLSFYNLLNSFNSKDKL